MHPHSPEPALSGRSLSGVEYRPGALVAGKYRLCSMLGAGGMGAVWLAQNELLDVPVALKLIRGDTRSSLARRRFLREARAAARLDHPSIVRVFDYGETEYGDPFLVMEAVRGRSIAELIARQGRLPATEAVRLALPIAQALEAAHQRGVVHRDLKPENVLVVREEDGRAVPKVLDFGVAKLIDSRPGDPRVTLSGTIVGSPEYMSPEQAAGRPDVDGRADVWALSVILYELLTARRPFLGVTHEEILTAVVHDEPTPITALGAGDSELWAIVARGLAKKRRERWGSMRELDEALSAWAVARGVDSDAAGLSISARNPALSGSMPVASSVVPSSGPHSLPTPCEDDIAHCPTEPGDTGEGGANEGRAGEGAEVIEIEAPPSSRQLATEARERSRFYVLLGLSVMLVMALAALSHRAMSLR